MGKKIRSLLTHLDKKQKSTLLLSKPSQMYAKLKKKKSVKTHKNTEGARGMIVEKNIKEVWNMKNK